MVDAAIRYHYQRREPNPADNEGVHRVLPGNSPARQRGGPIPQGRPLP